MPRKAAFENLLPGQRHDLAEAIVKAAGQAITPEKTTTLAKIFRLIGADETMLYNRLHTVQTTVSPDDFATIQTGKFNTGFALPPPTAKSPTKRRPTSGPTLDPKVIEQKQAETERVSALLSDIFSEEATIPPTLPATQTDDAPTAKNVVSAPQKATVVALVEQLSQKTNWSQAEFVALARTGGWLPNAAFEAVNEWSCEVCGDALLSGDTLIHVDPDLLTEILEVL